MIFVLCTQDISITYFPNWTNDPQINREIILKPRLTWMQIVTIYCIFDKQGFLPYPSYGSYIGKLLYNENSPMWHIVLFDWTLHKMKCNGPTNMGIYIFIPVTTSNREKFQWTLRFGSINFLTQKDSV